MKKLHTVRGEITKWLINEGFIKSTGYLKRMTYPEVLQLYLEKSREIEYAIQ